MHQSLADLRASLDRIRSLANNIAAETGKALTDPKVLALHETQQCGAIVLMTGYFEAFLKDLVRKFIGSLSASGVTFTSLSESIRNRHYEGGGKVLTEASKSARQGKVTPFGSATREDIVARLHSTSGITGTYQIVWEAFADTKANPGPDVVREIAENLGIKSFWPTISQNSGNPARWSNSALSTQLFDLITKRNACAHTGTVSPIPTVSELLDFADLLEAIANGFHKALDEELAEYKASLPPPPADGP